MKRYKRIKILICIATVIGALFTLTGCDSYDNFKHTFIDGNTESENVLVIGVFEPLSGDLKQEGSDELKGIELANKIYGNVQGMNIKLVKVDTQSNVYSAETAVQDLIALNPTAIIGSAGEASSMVASSYIKKAGVVSVTPSCTNPLITQDNNYYFRTSVMDSQIGVGLAEYAIKEMKETSLGIISIEDDNSSSSLINGFRNEVKDETGSEAAIVLQKTIDINDTELKGIVSEIEDSGASTIFLPLGAEKANILFTKLEKAGITDITFLGTKSWSSDKFVNMMYDHPQIKVVFPSDTMANAESETVSNTSAEAEKFLIEYANEYGEEAPTENAALGYDSYLLIVNAINNADSFKEEDIKNALAATDGLRSVTGTFKFDEDGNPIKSVNLSTITDGKVVSLYATKNVSVAEQVETIKKSESEEVS